LIPYTMPPQQRTSRTGIRALIALLLTLIIAGGSMYGMWRWYERQTSPESSKSYADICADTPLAVSKRATLVYTSRDFLSNRVEQESDSSPRWCVFGTNDNHNDLWWVAVYAGESSGIYRALVAERHETDDPPATLTYAGLPPIQFARDGWIAFITPSEDTWTAVHASAGARLLADLVTAARS
jgi:hypothetical protein